MKEITFGTTNEAKIKQIRGALAPAGIEVNGVLDKSLLPEVLEDGKTAIENAKSFYYDSGGG
jgi:inosine/xanthosine triphosphate pyrophosphatase family protein